MKLYLAKKEESKAKNFISTAYDFEKPLSDKKMYAKNSISYNLPVKKLLEKITCFDVKKIERDVLKHNTAEKKIFSIFENEEIISGDRKFLIRSEKYLLNKIKRQVRSNKPIVFTFLQFPFKIPNPLKTERTLPDLGEIAYLYQINSIAELIRKEYPHGARFVILGESLVFRDIADISMGEALTYREQSKWWIKTLGFQNNIEIVELRDAEQKIPSFNEALEKIELRIKSKFLKKDKEALDLVSSVTPTLLLSLNVRNFTLQHLMEIFDGLLNKKRVDKKDKEIMKELKRESINIALRYVAYHQAVKETNLREKLWPNNIGVSPVAKPERFGVFPLNKYNSLYPIHGVPVYNKNQYVTIRYKIDVLRDKNVKYAVKLNYGNNQEKLEKDAFFYSEAKV